MADERRSLAVTQVVVPGIALVIAGPIFAIRFSDKPLYVTLGVIAGVVGAGLLVFAFLRYRGNRG